MKYYGCIADEIYTLNPYELQNKVGELFSQGCPVILSVEVGEHRVVIAGGDELTVRELDQRGEQLLQRLKRTYGLSESEGLKMQFDDVVFCATHSGCTETDWKFAKVHGWHGGLLA